MSTSPEVIVAIIGLFLAIPPALAILWTFVLRRRSRTTKMPLQIPSPTFTVALLRSHSDLRKIGLDPVLAMEEGHSPVFPTRRISTPGIPLAVLPPLPTNHPSDMRSPTPHAPETEATPAPLSPSPLTLMWGSASTSQRSETDDISRFFRTGD